MGLLRLLLAFSVVIAHTSPVFGYVGIGGQAVPAFFIISGFYMNLVLSRKYMLCDNGIRTFYFNRFIRIFPIYWSCLLLAIFWALLPQDVSGSFLRNIIILENSVDALPLLSGC